MIGKEVTIPDIVLEELQELAQPIDLHCYEELPELPEATSEESEEEPERIPYKIVVPCSGCPVKLRLYVFATHFGIRALQALLLQEVQLICPQCREAIRHGGQ